MSPVAKKVTVNLPADTLQRARRITGKSITQTLIEGLQEIERREKRSALIKLQGKVKFDIDLSKTRR